MADAERVLPPLSIHPSRLNREENSTEEVSAEEWDQGFTDHFWPLYPRKAAKYAALLEWRKVKPRTAETFNQVVDGLERVLPTFRDREKEKVPHARTWLHQRRWEDEDA